MTLYACLECGAPTRSTTRRCSRHPAPARPMRGNRGRRRRARVIARDLGICHICGRPVAPGSEFLDHVVPLSRDGPDTEANLRVSHQLCNLRKGAST